MEIVATARRILEEEGPEALTMRRFAERLGIRAPSIYNHLPDKYALEAALISDGLQEQAELFEAAISDTADPLAELNRAHRDFARAHPPLYRLMTGRPLPRDWLTPGAEARYARPMLDIFGATRNARGPFGPSCTAW